jgi:hypothetical protein
MIYFGKILHNHDLTLVVGTTRENFTSDKFYGYDLISRKLKSFVNCTVVSFSKLFGLVDVEIIGYFYHTVISSVHLLSLDR